MNEPEPGAADGPPPPASSPAGPAARSSSRRRLIVTLGLLLAFGVGAAVAALPGRLRQAAPPPESPSAKVAGSAEGSDRLAAGRAIYERDCASCHGMRGEGQPNWQVPLADGSRPAPPHDATGHTWHHADGLLLQIIADGGLAYDDPNAKMPAFAGQLSAQQMEAVLAYIKTFWGPRERAFQDDQTQQWQSPSSEAPPVSAP